MDSEALLPLIAKYVVPGTFSMLFRIFGLGARSKKAAVSGMGVYWAVSILLPLLLIPLFGYDVYKRYCVLAMFAANLAVFLISSDNFVKTCFMHFTQANIIFWVVTVCSALRRVFSLSYSFLAVLITISCAAIFLFALRYFAKPLRFMADTIQSGWLWLLGVPGCTVLTGVMISVWFGSHKNYNAVFLILVISLLEAALMMYIHVLYHSLCDMAALSRNAMRQKLLESELSAYNDYLNAAKESRHDLRHHNAILLDYLESGNTEAAIEYLRGADRSLATAKLETFCANPTANAVLRMYSRKAQAKEISFAANVEFPEQLSLTAPEFGALLSNLLENAMESCEKVSLPERHITLSSRVEESGLCLELSNSVQGTVLFDAEGFPLSTKSGGGTCTRSIAHIVKSHGGMLRFQQRESSFFTQIVLPQQTEAAHETSHL